MPFSSSLPKGPLWPFVRDGHFNVSYVCVWVCVSLCVYVCVYVFVCLCVSLHVCVCVSM